MAKILEGFTFRLKDGEYRGSVNPKGRRYGFGVMTYKNGEVYEGEWKNDVRSGKGKMTYKNGDVYEGEWEYDSARGQGKMTYADGSEYTGGWWDGKIHGYGKMIYANGDIEEGTWSFGHPSSTKTRKGPSRRASTPKVTENNEASSKDSSTAPFKNEAGLDTLLERLAKAIGENGSKKRAKAVLTADEKIDKANESALLLIEAKERSDKEIEGLLLKISELEYELNKKLDKLVPESDTYEGEKNRHGEPHGMGTMKYASGEKYSGAWAHGDWYGIGLYITPDGVTYSGFFSSTRESSNVTRIAAGELPQHGKMRDGDFFKN